MAAPAEEPTVLARGISLKRKFVRDGVFYAELNELLMRELAVDGYAGCEVRRTPTRTDVIIKATRTQNVLGDRGQRIRELTSIVTKRFGLESGQIELFAQKVVNKGLSAIAQAESLRYKLSLGLPVRRACYGVVRNIMESEGRGCEIIVSGKLRGARAKSMKFLDGYMIKTGEPVKNFTDVAVRHVLLRQGILGLKVTIMLPFDPQGRIGGSRIPQPDVIAIREPKEDVFIPPPRNASYGPAVEAQQAAQQAAQAQAQAQQQQQQQGDY